MNHFRAGIFLIVLSGLLISCSDDKGTNSQGGALWPIAIGGTDNDYGFGIAPTDQGDYFIAGQNSNDQTGDDVLMIRIDSIGSVRWEKTITGSGADVAYAMATTDDGGFVCFGSTSSDGAMLVDFYLVKVSGSGAVQWSKRYGGSGFDLGYMITPVPSTGFLLAGSSGTVSAVPYVVKVDNAGTVIWETKITSSTTASASVALPMSNNHAQVVGWVQVPITSVSDIVIWELDEAGQEVSSRTYSSSSDDMCNAALRMSDNGLLLVGWRSSTGVDSQDMYAVRLDAQGDKVWENTYGGAASDGARAVVAASDGGYVLAGWTESMGAGDVDAYLVKIDGDGNMVWQRTYGGAEADRAQGIALTQDGGLIVVGSTTSSGAGLSDVYVIRTDANGRL